MYILYTQGFFHLMICVLHFYIYPDTVVVLFPILNDHGGKWSEYKMVVNVTYMHYWYIHS